MPTIRDIWLHAHSVIRSGRQIVNQHLHPLDLSSTEGNILLHMMMENGPMCQEDLVQQLDVTKAAISRAVDSLDAKGYIVRQKDLTDKRFYQLTLTEKALQTGTQIEQAYNHVYSLATKDISDEEFHNLIGLLERIAKNLAHE